MPITKERLIEIVTAAEAIEWEYTTTCSYVIERLKEIKEFPASLEANLDLIAQRCIGPEHNIINESKLIQSERIRWNLTHRRRDRERDRAYLKRRQLGIPTEADRINSIKERSINRKELIVQHFSQSYNLDPSLDSASPRELEIQATIEGYQRYVDLHRTAGHLCTVSLSSTASPQPDTPLQFEWLCQCGQVFDSFDSWSSHLPPARAEGPHDPEGEQTPDASVITNLQL